MTEEQYAIDYLKKYIETDMMYENRHYKQIELVLNLIQKQDKKIKDLKEHNSNLIKKSGEDIDLLLKQIDSKDTEIDKLNNVIDKMVKHIVEQTYKDLEECEFEDKYNINCNSSKRTCEDCIKEYFMKEDK